MMYGYSLLIFYGALLTVQVAGCALLLGLGAGMLLACLESSKIQWLRYSTKSFIFIIRGLPELLVLFVIYFGLSTVLSSLSHRAMTINAFTAGVIALGFIFAAYASQVLRGALMAIEYSQLEAAMALGLNRWQIFVRIQLPQICWHALPGLSNLWVALLKDTAIVSLIGLPEMMSQANLAASSQQQPFFFYCLAASFYLMMTTLSQKLVDRFDKQFINVSPATL